MPTCYGNADIEIIIVKKNNYFHSSNFSRALDPSDPVSVYEFINSMPQDESLDGVRLGLYSLLLTKYLLPDGETTEKGKSSPIGVLCVVCFAKCNVESCKHYKTPLEIKIHQLFHV